MSNGYVTINNLCKIENGNSILEDINLSIKEGEFFSILGASGCGKTTLLRSIAGFEPNVTGQIMVDGIDISHSPPHKRPVSMMFQSYAVFPHLSVWENIAFGLKQRGFTKDIIEQKVYQVADLTNLTGLLDRSPSQLSGGQLQRVALSRSLAVCPNILLLDEPFSALDPNLREKARFDLVDLQEKVGTTFIFVTHNHDEAMTMSDRIAIMSYGKVLQVGTPVDIYEYPNCLEVAQFMGSINIFPGKVLSIEDERIIVSGKIEYHIPYTSELPVDSEILISVRPEKMRISYNKPKQTYNCVHGRVSDIAYLGNISIYYVESDIGKVIATRPNIVRFSKMDISWNDMVYVYWDEDNACYFN